MTGIVWEEPPAALRGSTAQIAAFAAALRERPGEWALYPRAISATSMGSIGTRIKAGGSAFTPAGSFDAVTRVVDGERRLYVRYVGEAEQGAA